MLKKVFFIFLILLFAYFLLIFISGTKFIPKINIIVIDKKSGAPINDVIINYYNSKVNLFGGGIPGESIFKRTADGGKTVFPSVLILSQLIYNYDSTRICLYHPLYLNKNILIMKNGTKENSRNYKKKNDSLVIELDEIDSSLNIDMSFNEKYFLFEEILDNIQKYFEFEKLFPDISLKKKTVISKIERLFIYSKMLPNNEKEKKNLAFIEKKINLIKGWNKE